jgi:hypothetical protein
LLGAIAAGFATGRLVRGAQRASNDPGATPQPLGDDEVPAAAAVGRGNEPELTAPLLSIDPDGSVGGTSMPEPGAL